MRLLILLLSLLGFSSAGVYSVSEDNAKATDNLFRLSLGVLKEAGNKSLVFSPFSVAMALATVNLGANGKTSEQIRTAVFRGDASASINTWFNGKLDNLKKDYAKDVKIASKIYAEKSIAILGDYQKSLTAKFNTKVEKVDFAKGSQVQRAKINRFVSATTEGKIPELLAASQVTPQTRFIAVNAIYMKSHFAQSFDKTRTKKAAFHNEDKTKKQVDMMKDTKSGFFFENKDFAYAGIGLNPGFEFVVIVPKSGSLASLRDNFLKQSHKLTKVQEQQRLFPELQITMPKFKTEGVFALAEVLKKLGIKQLFGADSDLKGISKAKIQIDNLIHKAVIELDEEGVTAAAASATVMEGSAFCMADCTREIKADRPFIYAVVFNDIPMFVGQYY